MDRVTGGREEGRACGPTQPFGSGSVSLARSGFCPLDDDIVLGAEAETAVAAQGPIPEEERDRLPPVAPLGAGMFQGRPGLPLCNIALSYKPTLDQSGLRGKPCATQPCGL